MGSSQFLTKRSPPVSTERRLQVLAYKLKRTIEMLGAAQWMAAVKV